MKELKKAFYPTLSFGSAGKAKRGLQLWSASKALQWTSLGFEP
jgi:hypothetical protein